MSGHELSVFGMKLLKVPPMPKVKECMVDKVEVPVELLKGLINSAFSSGIDELGDQAYELLPKPTELTNEQLIVLVSNIVDMHAQSDSRSMAWDEIKKRLRASEVKG